ncbi:MAG TPA: class I SAM-dependent methyltransferase [Tepidisphaeraceae bacterium]|jgi:tRNA (cmo5U34)-methyltransferase
MSSKSTVDEIRQRFDHDVERFSDITIGQKAAVDSTLALDLIAEGTATVCPRAKALLDVGCGAGNWSLKLMERLPKLAVTLMDLSRPMLDRAEQRVRAAGAEDVRTFQGDVRDAHFDDGTFDLIVAGAVLHHLRGDDEWQSVFAAFHRWLRPGGSVWVYDMVTHSHPAINTLMTGRYGDYLTGIGGSVYQREVFAYIEKEDTPRPLLWQLDRLRDAGFAAVDVLHKSANFAAYAAVK